MITAKHIPHSLFHNPSDRSLIIRALYALADFFSLIHRTTFGDGLSYVLNHALCILTAGEGLRNKEVKRTKSGLEILAHTKCVGVGRETKIYGISLIPVIAESARLARVPLK